MHVVAQFGADDNVFVKVLEPSANNGSDMAEVTYELTASPDVRAFTCPFSFRSLQIFAFIGLSNSDQYPN